MRGQVLTVHPSEPAGDGWWNASYVQVIARPASLPLSSLPSTSSSSASPQLAPGSRVAPPRAPCVQEVQGDARGGSVTHVGLVPRSYVDRLQLLRQVRRPAPPPACAEPHAAVAHPTP